MCLTDADFPSDWDEPVDKGVDDTYGEHVKAELVDKLDDQPVKEPEVTPEPTEKVPPLVPQPNIPEYAWVEWKDPAALIEEEMLAKKHGIKNKHRGPVPYPNGPELWRDMPFNFDEGHWGYRYRCQLPATYRFHDWWSEDALKEEARLAREHMIPWTLRGPPDGPGPGTRKMLPVAPSDAFSSTDMAFAIIQYGVGNRQWASARSSWIT